MLLDILLPYLIIDPEEKRVYFTEKGHEQSSGDRILLFLLARKAMYAEKLVESEKVLPKSIIDDLGFKRGTLHPALKKMRDKGFVFASNGQYSVPNYQLHQIKKHFGVGL